ncbi:S-methyl-5-thioribose-1-phosphate isomerase [Rhizophlyctis rosea]|uniref:S-methyl-5-thioribose-1-phosphate isomerase n=1 Tax=Rhizophlyctis rosea TaxID=64517 RepID=A0AAD5S8V7_9FUNG|nr:S-methyl-5-thioribose-1-phosphate isomerase [Rhizophlyctis rosea]
MTNGGRTLEAIRYNRGSLEILNQLLLPWESIYEAVSGVEDGHKVIKTMKVRGAPAIAIVAALSLAVDLHNQSIKTLTTPSSVATYVHDQLKYLKTSRPTAVNLFEAAARLDRITSTAAQTAESASQVLDAYIDAAEAMLVQDIEDNKNIGKFGAQFILDNKPELHEGVQVLTHCNTGSLATAGWVSYTLISKPHSQIS